MKKGLGYTARFAAVETLTRWGESQSRSMAIIFTELARELAPDERRLARTLVYGVLRQQNVLDAVIADYSSHPLKKMKVRTLMTLRIGVYQLLFLTRIPDSAAVNATVNTLKEAGQPRWLIGFVNGLLRKVAGERAGLGRFCLDSAGEPLPNHPLWLCNRWQKRFGHEQARAICAVNNMEPPLSLRVNTRRISRGDFVDLLNKSGIGCRKSQLSPVGVEVIGYPGPITTLTGYVEGFFQVQDDAAQLASFLIKKDSEPLRVLDACAGLGGKTSHLVEILPPGSTVRALEPDERRYSLLTENLHRLGHLAQAQTLRSTLEDYVRMVRPRPFDALFVDAPCSGTGVIRRQPDIRWNRLEKDLLNYQKGQLALLTCASAILKPGGIMVYATCSLEEEENEQVIEQFLAGSPQMYKEDATAFLPESAHSLTNEKGDFAPLPLDGCDGFFACRLRRHL